jgi:hypothetical protein
MDFNPLIGEPEFFRVIKFKEAVLKLIIATITPFIAQPPKQIQMIGLPKEMRKGSKGGEKSPAIPWSGLKDKKGRRKCKAAGATMTVNTTPK